MMKRLLQVWSISLALVLWALVVACPSQAPPDGSSQEQSAEVTEPTEPSDSSEKTQEATSEPTSELPGEAGESTAEVTQDGGEQPPESPPSEKKGDDGTTEKTPDAGGQGFEIKAAGGKACYKHICVDLPGAATPDKDVMLTIKEASSVPGGSLVPPMDVGPDNWMPTGQAKITITFDYSAATLPAGVSPAQLRVAYVAKGRWIFVDTTVDAANKTVSGETTHLSVWGLVYRDGQCGRAPDCFDAQTCGGNLRCGDAACSSNADCRTDEVCQTGACKACVAMTEFCDGADNDCDGQVDNGVSRACYNGPSGTSGVGQCADGTQTCSAGRWGACVGSIPPTKEVCDGIDNDCNGQVDEACQSCRSDADCQSGEKCTNGRCNVVCGGNQTVCASGCTDLQSDGNHCGRCENVCQSGESCQAGTCQ